MNKTITIAAHAKNKKILFQSSSGGVFYALAKHVLNNLNGIVYGCTIDGKNVFHKRIDSFSDLPLLMKSKYVQSDLNNSFECCKEDLQRQKYVLFVATPCRIFALKKYLEAKKTDQSRLIAVDFVCHGTPAKKYWSSYYDEKFGHENIDFDFRFNKPSWRNYSVAIKTSNKFVVENVTINEFMSAFLHNYIFVQSCYECAFKANQSCSDITLGDFWGCDTFYPEIYSKYGTSIVVIRRHDNIVFNSLKNEYSYIEVNPAFAFYFNKSYYRNAQIPVDKAEFDKCFLTTGFLAASRKFCIKQHKNSKKKVKIHFDILKPLFKKRKISELYKNAIGIITDYGYYNFGNRLQNYALRTKINGFGYKTVNLALHRHSSYKLIFGISKMREATQISKDKKYYRKCKAIKRAAIISGDETMYFAYDSFGKKQVQVLSGVIIGSDQIWNWTYHNSDLPFALGFFGCNFEKPIFSYAASIGTNYLDENVTPFFAHQLAKFTNVGVREETAKQLLQSIGIGSSINLDPTLLLGEKEWDEAIADYSNLKLPQSPYCLKYILGKHSSTHDVLWDGLTVDLENKKTQYYSINHFDFVSLIKNSSLIITDSFHAFIFALIYSKKIILISRDGMNSRFDNLFSLLNIQLIENAIIDLSLVDKTKINKSRDYSLQYLEDSLKKIIKK